MSQPQPFEEWWKENGWRWIGHRETERASAHSAWDAAIASQQAEFKQLKDQLKHWPHFSSDLFARYEAAMEALSNESADFAQDGCAHTAIACVNCHKELHGVETARRVALATLEKQPPGVKRSHFDRLHVHESADATLEEASRAIRDMPLPWYERWQLQSIGCWAMLVGIPFGLGLMAGAIFGLQTALHHWWGW